MRKQALLSIDTTQEDQFHREANDLYEATIKDPKKLYVPAVTAFNFDIEPAPTKLANVIEMKVDAIDKAFTAVTTNLNHLKIWLGPAQHRPRQTYQQTLHQNKSKWEYSKHRADLAHRAYEVVQWYAIKHLFNALWDKYITTHRNSANHQKFASLYQELLTAYRDEGIPGYEKKLSEKQDLHQFLIGLYTQTVKDDAQFILNLPFDKLEKGILETLLRKEFAADTSIIHQIDVPSYQNPFGDNSSDSDMEMRLLPVREEKDEDEEWSQYNPNTPSGSRKVKENQSSPMNKIETLEWLNHLIDTLSLYDHVRLALKRMHMFLIDDLNKCQGLRKEQQTAHIKYKQTMVDAEQSYRTQFANTPGVDLSQIIATGIGQIPPQFLTNNTGNTLLHVAMEAYKGKPTLTSYAIVDYLIKERGFSISALNLANQTPYQYAGITSPDHQWDDHERENLSLAVVTPEQQQALAVVTQKSTELYGGGLRGLAQRGLWWLIYGGAALTNARQRVEQGILVLSFSIVNHKPIAEIQQMIRTPDAYFWKQTATINTGLLQGESRQISSDTSYGTM